MELFNILNPLIGHKLLNLISKLSPYFIVFDNHGDLFENATAGFHILFKKSKYFVSMAANVYSRPTHRLALRAYWAWAPGSASSSLTIAAASMIIVAVRTSRSIAWKSSSAIALSVLQRIPSQMRHMHAAITKHNPCSSLTHRVVSEPTSSRG